MPLFPNFRKFWLNGKRPQITLGSSSLSGLLFLSGGPRCKQKQKRGRTQDNYCLQTSFSNIKVRPKNVNYAQVFEVTGAPLSRARSPDKLSCKSENGVGDKGDTFKARRIRAKSHTRALRPSIFWKGIKKLGSEPFTFYTSPLSPLSFHVSGVCNFLTAVISSCSYLCNGKPLWCRCRCR